MLAWSSSQTIIRVARRSYGLLDHVKRLTRLAARKGKAARFTETVLDDPDRADEIRGESLEDYANRRKFEITIPEGGAEWPAKQPRTIETKSLT